MTLIRRIVPGRSFAPVPLRVIMGLAFIVHGYPKIAHLALTAQNFAQRGFVPGLFWASLVAIVECVGGACLVLGLFTRLWSAAIAVEMVVTTLVVKRPRGVPFVGAGRGSGYELDLIYLAVALALVALGGGMLSLDRGFTRSSRFPPGDLAADRRAAA